MPNNLDGQQRSKKLTEFMVVVVVCVVSALILAAVFPVTSLLVGLAITISCTTVLVVPDVRAFLRKHVSFVVLHPKFGKRVASGAAFGVLLFCASVSRLMPQSQGRPTVQKTSRSSDSAAVVRRAEMAIDIGDLEQANQLAQQLEADPTSISREDVKQLRERLHRTAQEKEKRRANDRVLRLMIDANQDFLAKRFQKVDSALREAFAEAGATDLKEAHALANRLLLARLAVAEERLAANDLDAAGSLIQQAEAIPGLREKRAIAELQLRLANARVLERIALAQKRTEEQRWSDAEAELNAAIAIKNASDLADSGTMSPKVEAERTSESNRTAAQNRGFASQFLFVKSKMDEEGNILEIYAVEGRLDIENLKNLCQQKQHRTRAKSVYYLVLFDDPANARFPSTQFRDRFGADDSARRHIRAIYEFNRSSGYSELEYYDTNAVDGRLTREHIKSTL